MRLVARTALVAFGLAAAASLVILPVWGFAASLGLIGGTSLATLSVLSFGLLGKVVAAEGAVPRQVAMFTVMVWVLKLPLLWLFVSLAVRAGQPATGCFLGGLALVYSVLVLTARSRPEI